MQLNKAIELAAEKEGSQRALAKTLGIGENYLSDMKQGLKPCTVENRIRIALIAGIDPTRAVIEGLAATLSDSDEHQAEAKAMLNAMLDAFPEEGERNSSHVSRILIKILTKYRHLFSRALTRNKTLRSGSVNTKQLSYGGVGIFPRGM